MKNKNGTIFASTLISVALLAGCTLNTNVPKATIAYNPVTHKIQIASHKDICMTNLTFTIATNGTTTFTIGSYESKANIEVVKAAVEAQQQQIKGSLDAIDKVLTAAGAVK